MRKGFTLIEILLVVAIIAVMIASGAALSGANKAAAKLRGASRDAFAAIRQARSLALVSQKPCVITYSCSVQDGEAKSKIEIVSAKLTSSSQATTAETLDGDIVTIGGQDAEPVPAENGTDGEIAGETAGESAGETLEEILFAPIHAEVLEGVVLKIEKEGDVSVESVGEEKARSKISVFSNVDYILGRYKESKAREKAEQDAAQSGPPAAGEEESPAADAGADVAQEPVSIVWESNGRCEPHTVVLYSEGSSPERGFRIKIDRYGSAKILGTGDGEE